jgi:hypothetical protein
MCGDAGEKKLRILLLLIIIILMENKWFVIGGKRQGISVI